MTMYRRNRNSRRTEPTILFFVCVTKKGNKNVFVFDYICIKNTSRANNNNKTIKIITHEVKELEWDQERSRIYLCTPFYLVLTFES